MKKRIAAFIMAVFILLSSLPVYAGGDKSVRILYTHDIHSHLEKASRLATLIQEERENYGAGNTVLLDGGDFSQGTIIQAAYETSALEIGMLSNLGFVAATIGNHEWDHAGRGFGVMLETAAKRYDSLTPLLCANVGAAEVPTAEQTDVLNSLDFYNAKAGIDSKDYMIYETENGVKLGIFGVSGIESIEDSPTSGMVWANYIESAKEVAAKLKDQCDAIICLSHSGTEGDGLTGEDVELAKAVPEINLIISAHSHTTYAQPVYVGETLIASCGCYGANLGVLNLNIDGLGNVSFDGYQLRAADDSVEPNAVVESLVQQDLAMVDEDYLALYGYKADQVIAHSSFDFMSLDNMYASHQEYPLGNLIADSYLYAARANGIDDIDVALVGLGTIRDSIEAGDITVSDAFEICSLGVSEDGSSGHPLVAAYVTGSELKLLVQLDASLGPLVNAIKMSYSGLRYQFNTSRMILDRGTDIRLVDEFGLAGERAIEDDKLYKVCCNMYAANMLGMVNDLTKGILKIVPKDAEGNPVEDLYTCALKDSQGNDIKEWYAFASYLDSLDEIPNYYASEAGRKVKISDSSISALTKQPGLPTIIVMVAIVLVLLILFGIIKLIIYIVHRVQDKEKNAERGYR